MPTWKLLSTEKQLKRLTPPTGKITMVLDTDTFNEVDDQFALAYALLSEEKLSVKAVYAAPFLNKRSQSAKDGMEKSYAEILRLLAKMGRIADGFVLKGADCFLKDEETPVDSAAARDIVRRAHEMQNDEPLYVVAIGAITNVASALIIDPSITEKIVVIWLGGNPLGYPTAVEFNLMQDLYAVRTVLDCGVPLTIVPCMGVASHMLATVPELQTYIGGKNPLCDTLIELFSAYTANHVGWAKEIWDVAPIGYLNNPDWVPTVLVHSPLLSDDCHWAQDARRHLIRMAYFAMRTPIFQDMYRKLSNKL